MTEPIVAFDATPVISGSTGVARYVTQLGSALEQSGVELRRFAVGRRSFPLPANTKHVRFPARIVQACWRRSPWPTLERLIGASDLVHATGVLMPRTRRPLVVTVHDVVPLRHPELFPARQVEQQRSQVDALDLATIIITVSAATADDLLHLGIPQEKLVIAPLGASPLSEATSSADRSHPGYLLTVGESAPHKGYELLLRALSRLADGTRLVMVGPPASDDQRLRALASDLGVAARVSFLGAVTDSVLAGLYADALALCFPSLAEGFGLPVLEAMTAGIPVVASDIPATRELAGGAAMYVGSRDGGAWADALEALALDSRLRAALSRQGRERAKAFTWERTAAATLDAYRLALAGE